MKNKTNAMFIVSTILVIAMVLIIFVFSTQQGESSVGMSKNIIDQLIEKLGIQGFVESNEWIYENRNIIFRKILHFCEYALLATLVFNTLKLRNVKLKYIPVITMLFACMVAAADEFYQSHVPGRTPQIRDVFIDSIGALTAVSIILLKLRFRKIKKASNNRIM